MSEWEPTLADIKVALAMGFMMPNGQDPGDALDDYIEEVCAGELAKAAQTITFGVPISGTPIFGCPICFMPWESEPDCEHYAVFEALAAAIRGDEK